MVKVEQWIPGKTKPEITNSGLSDQITRGARRLRRLKFAQEREWNIGNKEKAVEIMQSRFRTEDAVSDLLKERSRRRM